MSEGEYNDFVKEQLRRVAVAIGVPYEVLVSDPILSTPDQYTLDKGYYAGLLVLDGVRLRARARVVDCQFNPPSSILIYRFEREDSGEIVTFEVPLRD